MLRPEDYGDKFPSDVGDVTPPDDFASLKEVDYVVNVGQSRPLSSEPTKRQITEIPFRSKLPTPRDVLQGYIVRRIDNRNFRISLNDGNLITASLRRKDFYEVFNVGDPVTVIRGTDGVNWYIDTIGREKELELIVYHSNWITIETDDIVPFSTASFQIPKTTKFTQSSKLISLQGPGEVLLTADQDGDYLFDIRYSLIVEQDLPTFEGGTTFNCCSLERLLVKYIKEAVSLTSEEDDELTAALENCCGQTYTHGIEEIDVSVTEFGVLPIPFGRPNPTESEEVGVFTDGFSLFDGFDNVSYTYSYTFRLLTPLATPPLALIWRSHWSIEVTKRFTNSGNLRAEWKYDSSTDPALIGTSLEDGFSVGTTLNVDNLFGTLTKTQGSSQEPSSAPVSVRINP